MLVAPIPQLWAGEILDTLTAFRPSTLSQLEESGLRVEVGGLATNLDGLYEPKDPLRGCLHHRVVLNRSLPMSRLRKTVLHEVAHAVDGLLVRNRVAATLGASTYGTDTDARLRTLHRAYLARASLERALAIRGLGRSRGCLREEGFALHYLYLPGERGERSLVVLSNTGLGDLAKGAGYFALALVSGVGRGPAALLNAWSSLRLAGRGLQDLRNLQWSRQEVELESHPPAQVFLGPGFTVVELPTSKVDYTAIWSTYAAVTGRPTEYFAEGVMEFFSGPQERSRLRSLDPQMHEYVADLQL